jgi:hypothetical protein
MLFPDEMILNVLIVSAFVTFTNLTHPPDNFLLPSWRSTGFHNFFRAFPLSFACSILDHRKIWLIE